MSNKNVAYDRKAYMPRGWRRDDGVDVRQKILTEQSLIPVTLGDNGLVATGLWEDPYTWGTQTDAKQVDIEHCCPLHWANAAGLHRAPDAVKQRFALDERHLIPAFSGANRARGAKSISEWVPSCISFWDDWAETIISTCYEYRQWITIPAEEQAVLTHIKELGQDVNKGVKKPIEVLAETAFVAMKAHEERGFFSKQWGQLKGWNWGLKRDA